jgi:hypothetical protein
VSLRDQPLDCSGAVAQLHYVMVAKVARSSTAIIGAIPARLSPKGTEKDRTIAIAQVDVLHARS